MESENRSGGGDPRVATSAEDVIAHARSCWEEANGAVAGMGDEEVNAMVRTPRDMTLPGQMGFHLFSDELLAHRDQLYVYTRLCGAAPPHLWHFDPLRTSHPRLTP